MSRGALMVLASVVVGVPAPLPEMRGTNCSVCSRALWALPGDLQLMTAEDVEPICMPCAALITAARGGDVQLMRDPRQDEELRSLGYDAVAESDAAMVAEMDQANRTLRRRSRYREN